MRSMNRALPEALADTQPRVQRPTHSRVGPATDCSTWDRRSLAAHFPGAPCLGIPVMVRRPVQPPSGLQRAALNRERS